MVDGGRPARISGLATARIIGHHRKLVLGTIGQDDAPFGQGSLVRFRARMVAHDLDKRLLDRTVELAKSTRGFGWQALRAAFDSSPLVGAGRVEDTWNLIGRAMRHLVAAVAKVLGQTVEQVCASAKVSVLRGSSIKGVLDIDWDDPEARTKGLARLVSEAESLRAWVHVQAGEKSQGPPLDAALADLARVIEQDTEPDPDAPAKRRLAVKSAPDLLISLGDRDMRHGRKSSTKLINGYKRHVATVQGHRLVLAIVVRPANEAEYRALAPLLEGLPANDPLEAVLFDRGYLASPEVPRLIAKGVDVVAKPWSPGHREDGLFGKEDFAVDLDRGQVRCPAGVTATIGARLEARFGSACRDCLLRARCTNAKNGRTIQVHAQEGLLQTLRARMATAEGRRAFGARVSVEHTLARIAALQGPRARYRGLRMNTLDARRHSTVTNLMTLKNHYEAA